MQRGIKKRPHPGLLEENGRSGARGQSCPEYRVEHSECTLAGGACTHFIHRHHSPFRLKRTERKCGGEEKECLLGDTLAHHSPVSLLLCLPPPLPMKRRQNSGGRPCRCVQWQPSHLQVRGEVFGTHPHILVDLEPGLQETAVSHLGEYKGEAGKRLVPLNVPDQNT